MHAQEGAQWKRESQERNGLYELASDAELLRGMRAADELAFAEFIIRFKDVLLEVARALRIAPAERSQVVVELLDDVAIELSAAEAVVPVSLAGYLVRALRHRLLNARRESMRRLIHESDSLSDLDGGSERAARTLCSEASVRYAHGVDVEVAPLSPGLRKLARLIDDSLSNDERLILGWVSNLVPHRTIGDWLGVNRSAAMVRIWRLRNRLRDAAFKHANHLTGRDREEVMSFLSRFSEGTPLDKAVEPNHKDPSHEP